MRRAAAPGYDRAAVADDTMVVVVVDAAAAVVAGIVVAVAVVQIYLMVVCGHAKVENDMGSSPVIRRLVLAWRAV